MLALVCTCVKFITHLDNRVLWRRTKSLIQKIVLFQYERNLTIERKVFASQSSASLSRGSGWLVCLLHRDTPIKLSLSVSFAITRIVSPDAGGNTCGLIQTAWTLPDSSIIVCLARYLVVQQLYFHRTCPCKWNSVFIQYTAPSVCLAYLERYKWNLLSV